MRTWRALEPTAAPFHSRESQMGKVLAGLGIHRHRNHSSTTSSRVVDQLQLQLFTKTRPARSTLSRSEQRKKDSITWHNPSMMGVDVNHLRTRNVCAQQTTSTHHHMYMYYVAMYCTVRTYVGL